jgi:hypothetical protein
MDHKSDVGNKNELDLSISVQLEMPGNSRVRGELSPLNVHRYVNDTKNDLRYMEEYLKPLNSRRFKNRKNWQGKEVNMNIVVINLSDETRAKILAVDGDVYDDSDKLSPTLNGVDIDIVDLLRGIPSGYDNTRFKIWKRIKGY